MAGRGELGVPAGQEENAATPLQGSPAGITGPGSGKGPFQPGSDRVGSPLARYFGVAARVLGNPLTGPQVATGLPGALGWEAGRLTSITRAPAVSGLSPERLTRPIACGDEPAITLRAGFL
jgi:hypothetical protein